MNQRITPNMNAIEEGSQAVVALVDEYGEFVEVLSGVPQMWEEEELIGMNLADIVVDPHFEFGQKFEEMLIGNCHHCTTEIIDSDGSIIEIEYDAEPVTHDGESCVEVTIVDAVQIESAEDSDPATFDNIDNTDLEEISQNVRVDAPSGEMPLNAVMMDLAVGHNELEQYKKGALSLQKAIDERLQEEQSCNPDSKTCEVLEEVRDAAFGLYLRIQRGDEELHGKRSGKYSGYFN